MTPLLSLQDLRFTYPGGSAPILDGLSLDLYPGEFLVLCGPSGCGKSTLLRHLKPALAPHGTRSGALLFQGQPLEALSPRAQAQRIGFVHQDPESQLVTEKVWHELAFGLESLGFERAVIRRRTAETADFFGIQSWFHKPVWELSGGQKQLLNLAAVLTMGPDLLVLDEPTAQLDPIAAGELLSVLGRINRELGVTVLLTEHRLEEALPLAHRMAILEQGRLRFQGPPKEAGPALRGAGAEALGTLPAPMRVWAASDSPPPCPVTVGEGREWLHRRNAETPLLPLPPEPEPPPLGETVLEAREVWFRYEAEAPDVVRGLSLGLHRGEFLALLGGNGAGKSTSLKLLAGLAVPDRGEVRRLGRTLLLPQDPQTLFVKKTVRADLTACLDPLPQDQRTDQLAQVVRLCRLESLLDRHPYDLSGGERQRAALAQLLLLKPDVLLLDEPTKGLDASFKEALAGILETLLEQGTAVLMVSHDIEFCARHARRCALFFDGSIAAEDPPRAFFSGNHFYTTAANRMARALLPQAVTAEDLILACGGTLPAPQEDRTEIPPLPAAPTGEAVPAAEAAPASERRLPRRSIAAAGLVLLLIPVTLFWGQSRLGGQNYYLLSLLLLLEAMLPFFLLFEGRRPQARELVLIASLCALGVAGRAAFFMLPQFKPIMAITILSGIAFGGETGFLVGSVTMLASNALFGQGPMTPWQMFAMGLTGFLAGLLFRRGLPRRGRAGLMVYAVLAALLLYGVPMNLASALMWLDEINGKILLGYCLTGLPMDCVQAAATCFFLWFGAEPFLEKLERIRVKYGLLD